MIAPAACILYTQDHDLVRRSKAFLRSLTNVRHVHESDRLAPVLQQSAPALLLLDLRGKESRDLLEQVQAEWTEVLIVALGTARSEPLREAEHAGIYAAEDLGIDRRRLQALVSRAFDYLRLLEENRALREEPREPLALSPNNVLDLPREASASLYRPLLNFTRLFRRFENMGVLLQSIVEALAEATSVTRVGIFSRDAQGDHYRFRAGLRCLPETEEIEYRARDPLLRWFETHAHLISRAHLAQNGTQAERQVLRRVLDNLGAEVIVPLQIGGRITGWIFFGHRLIGQPFDYPSLEQLTILADQVSALIENALLNEEATRQRTLAETLLTALPEGIVAADEDAVIRCFNPTSQEILGLNAESVLNKAVECAGSRVASLLRETLESDSPPGTQQWVDPKTRRSFSVETRRLLHQRKPLGAVAVIQDRTPEEALRQKAELIDRAEFWSDLAASMSHEIRNPLVAIKTFAQLLPERFDDPDFRRDFNEIVVQEIERLDRIITQINNFAHPPELNFKPIDVRAPVQQAVEILRSRTGPNGFSIETAFPDDLPRVVGDEKALAEVFAHLMTNAAEAISGQPKAKITLSARSIRDHGRTSAVLVTVHDNGKGISADLKDKIFSPFCTTKARGMGLGLPIVKRTVFDHNGRVDVESNPQGTSVNVMLPVAENGE